MKRREESLDLIRTLALTLVVCVHFFLNTGYYTRPLSGAGMLVMTMLRMAFMVCVPLFLLLTGYLCREKELTPRYFLGLVRVLLTYVLCGLVCLGVRLWRGEALAAGEAVRSLVSFTAAPYGWYIRMYLGLFLVIPFLNALWRGLETRGRRVALITGCVLLTVLPAVTGALPAWWWQLYPLCYYFLGAYFAQYAPRPDWRWAVPVLLAAVAAEGALVFLGSGGAPYAWSAFGDWGGPGVILSSCLLFLLLRQVPADRAPGWVRWALRKGAELSLAAYLLSWIFDSAFYPRLGPGWRAVFAIPAVLVCALLSAQVIEWARKGLTWCINKIIPKAKLR